LGAFFKFILEMAL